jgi:L-alanine-DL-glutamate epimerase-like enolase superfamily enzyme
MAPDAPLTRLRVAAYRIPTDGPEADGTLGWDATVMVAAHLDAAGETGFGYGYADRATAAILEGVLWPVLAGRDPFDIPALWRAMLDRVRNHGRQGVAAMALSIADLALHDLKARLLGLPLVRLLGSCRESAAIYGSGGFLTYSDDRLARQVCGWAEEGMAAVKIKVGADLATERRRIKLARHAAPDAALMIDANGSCTRKEALALADLAAHHGVTYFEEPVSSDDLEGLRLLRDKTGLAIAAGEYGWDAFHFRSLLEAGAVDILQADVTRCGGITGLFQADALAFVHGVPLSIHCAPAISLAPALALQRLVHVEWFADHARIEAMLLDGAPVPEGGRIAPDLARPGHGLALKTEAAERFLVHLGECG